MQLTVGNNWNSILYPLIDATNWWTSWYWIVYRVRGPVCVLCGALPRLTAPAFATLPQFTMTDAVVSLIEAVMIEAFQAAQLERAGEEAEEGRLAEVVRRESMVGGDDVPSFALPSLSAPPVGELDKLQAELFADVAAAEAQAEVGDGQNREAGGGWDGARVVVGIPRSELALLAQALRGHELSLDRRNRGGVVREPSAAVRTGPLAAPLLPPIPSPPEMELQPTSHRAAAQAAAAAGASEGAAGAPLSARPLVKEWA